MTDWYWFNFLTLYYYMHKIGTLFGAINIYYILFIAYDSC